MSDKLKLLKAIDQKVYKHLINQMDKIKLQAKHLNNGTEYVYKTFDLSDTDFFIAGSPNQLTKAYLDEQLTELAPVMNERARVNAYLLRYTNQIAGWKYPTVMFLLPENIRTFTDRDVFDSMVDTHVLAKLEEFAALPEFQLIKKRLFIGGLYGC
jgi:hypothetical protein